MQIEITSPKAIRSNFQNLTRPRLLGSVLVLAWWLSLFMMAGQATAHALDSPFEMEVVTGGSGTELAVYEAGNPDGAEIVFLHGLMGSHLAWIGQLSGPLAEDYRLIAVDLRGHANSDRPLEPDAYTASDDWARDIHAVLEAKSLENPVLVGWSYGPRLIKDYIRYFGQQRLAGVVFVSSAPVFAGTEEEFALYGAGMLALFDDLLSTDDEVRLQATSAFLSDLLTAEPLDSATLDMVLDIAMLVPPAARVGMFSRLLDNTDVVADLAVPTLFIHGEADLVVDPQASSDMADLADEADLLLYPETGHAPFLENPTRFDADLAAFMSSLSDPLAGLSGNWHEPGTAGQGWTLLAAENGLFGFYYGYSDHGEPVWMITAEVISDIRAGIPVSYTLLKGSGGSIGNPVPPENLEQVGELVLTFQSCEEATAEITTDLGNETKSLERFTAIRGTQGCGLQEAEF